VTTDKKNKNTKVKTAQKEREEESDFILNKKNETFQLPGRK